MLLFRRSNMVFSVGEVYQNQCVQLCFVMVWNNRTPKNSLACPLFSIYISKKKKQVMLFRYEGMESVQT